MMFLGNGFCSSVHSGDSLVSNIEINNIQLSHGVYDNLYVDQSILNYNRSNIKWNYTTILYAMFQDDLLAGNLDISIGSISSLRIKIREKGTFDWKTIKEIPIQSPDDLKIIESYKYCRGNTVYEIALVPVLNDNIEGNINLSEVYSEFSGVYLLSRDASIHAFMNVQLTHTKEQTNTTINTLGRAKPFYIANSKNKYDTGTLSATFIPYNVNTCEFNVRDGWKYREQIDNILTDNRVKIIKTDEGQMWMVCIVNKIVQDNSEHYLMPIHKISWVEVGDCDSVEDMYSNGFLEEEL